ncbi:MAG: hypothetical protein MJY78_07460, partial [Fibrobacter sp.]|nr:hypothetical protein [Fibrobacter sp.]
DKEARHRDHEKGEREATVALAFATQKSTKRGHPPALQLLQDFLTRELRKFREREQFFAKILERGAHEVHRVVNQQETVMSLHGKAVTPSTGGSDVLTKKSTFS